MPAQNTAKAVRDQLSLINAIHEKLTALTISFGRGSTLPPWISIKGAAYGHNIGIVTIEGQHFPHNKVVNLQCYFKNGNHGWVTLTVPVVTADALGKFSVRVRVNQRVDATGYVFAGVVKGNNYEPQYWLPLTATAED